jgi:nucleotide-binding universal stress UspA family protein
MKRLDLRNVLCPMDLSPLSVGALNWANAIARAHAAELRALHVVVSKGAAAPAGLGFLEREAMMLKLREALAKADSTNEQIGAAVRQGPPGTQILRVARSIPADLIVMGAAGAERPERPIGSVTWIVVTRSDCPVLTVPTGRAIGLAADSGVFKRIVCAVDSAPSSTTVIGQALSLAWETHGHVTFTCVLPEGGSTSAAQVRSDLLAAIPSEASVWCDTEVVVTRGTPSTVIASIAETLIADLVVIGPPRRWASTTQAVLGRSLCPVLVTHDARPLPKPSSRATAGTIRGDISDPMIGSVTQSRSH